MQFEEWQPAYTSILTDFGYDRIADERARDVLVRIVADEDPLTPDEIDLSGTVAVCGAGPTLTEDLPMARSADCVVAASTAADVCLKAGIEPDCMVTDIDKNPETARTLSKNGTPVAAHAHGDNIELLERYVPTFEISSVLPTTQARPIPPVVNLGGFTDGDRAAFLADACGADRLIFPGWSFDDPGVSPEKARKLVWAERLLLWLERRRNERFPLLDGRRTEIELPWE